MYLGFGGAVGVLTAIAVLFPNTLVRLLAVAGLAGVGAAYVIAVDRLADRYQHDLAAVRSGQPVSGEVRAEVFHEIGFERDREDDWQPSPARRRPSVEEVPSRSEPPDEETSAMSSTRSGPPSAGS